MVQSAIGCYLAILHYTQLVLLLFEYHCIVLIFLMTVCCTLDYVMFDVSGVTCMADWIETEIEIISLE
jgi:hypothetical protein